MLKQARKPIRVAIVGNVPQRHKNAAVRFVAHCLGSYKNNEVEIISERLGGFADQYGRSNQIAVKHIEADWHKNGRKAGVLCNNEISRDATHVIALWDGRSWGMRHLIQLAQKNCKAVRVWNTRTGKHDRTYYL